jgi:hypothetical protein
MGYRTRVFGVLLENLKESDNLEDSGLKLEGNSNESSRNTMVGRGLE